MRTRLITICTNRKRLGVDPELDIRTFEPAIQDSLVAAWTSKTDLATERFPARDVYCGRGFQEALATVRLLQTELHIISAGLGLISASENIPSYNATLSRTTDSSISSRVKGDFDAARWWAELNHANGKRQSISEIVRRNPKDLFVITLTASYIELVSQDLLNLNGVDTDRIRIIGPTSVDRLPEQLQGCLMPYDDRFDGPDGPMRGTRSDFPQRASRHFSQFVLPKAVGANFGQHGNLVERFLAPLRRPVTVTRRKLSDDQMIEAINKFWERVNGNSAKMLRFFRDHEKIACEQGRFARLFRQVKSQRLAQ